MMDYEEDANQHHPIYDGLVAGCFPLSHRTSVTYLTHSWSSDTRLMWEHMLSFCQTHALTLHHFKLKSGHRTP